MPISDISIIPCDCCWPLSYRRRGLEVQRFKASEVSRLGPLLVDIVGDVF